MNIVFTIDALIDSGKEAWRLTANQAVQGQPLWRGAKFAEALQRGDYMAESGDAIHHQLGLRLRKDRQFGLVQCGRSGVFDFLQRGIFTHAVVHRLGGAPLPDVAQLRSTIAAMAPGQAQLLYLDLGGVFRSRPATGLIHNIAIAVRGEVASSAQFLGEDAAANDDYIAMLWQQFAAGWWQHLSSRRINTFVPPLEQCPPAEESLQKVARFVPEVLP